MLSHFDGLTPRDDFPPHGYLNNPWHSWKLTPSGVLRSRPPAGMGWHVPNFGSYGRSQFTYRAHLHAGLEVNGKRLLTPEDFRRAKVAVGCELHTKNRLRYTWAHPSGIRVAATFFLAAEQALACRVELSPPSSAATPIDLRLWVAQEIAHNPATSRLWEHGPYAALPGASEPETGPCGLLGIAPEGDAWVHGAAADAVPRVPTLARHDSAPLLLGKYASPREPADLQFATLLLAYDLTLAPGTPVAIQAVLARGVSPDAALRSWHDALSGFDAALAGRAAEDERFWSRAPRLSGDWPAHWRRGMATDFETLRMVERPATGVFARSWDGMQIQAPRSVLAETALDALALSWADPEAAKGLLLSCFAAAPRPNVPCMREDGSYNMIADDGAICGTGPEWGWPFLVVDALYQRTGDREWLGKLYPHLAAYLDWWLTHRVDAEGWLVHACSWESGQDVSTRFGAQSTGGSDVRHLRPVDLQAAVAHACLLVASWAPDSEQRTRFLGAGLALRTRYSSELWRNNWYADYDARRGAWSDVRDPMQLAPLMFPTPEGDRTAERIAAQRPTFGHLPPHCGVYPALVWPPVALTVLEAAICGGHDLVPDGPDGRASELAAGILDRTWRRMDAHELEPDGAIPGVTREYWPEGGAGISAGIEGYGWGALTVHFLLRYLVGLREKTADTVEIVPSLPVALRRPGVTYTVGPIPFGPGAFTVSYVLPRDTAPDRVDVSIAIDGPWNEGWAYEANLPDSSELDHVERVEAGPLRLAWPGRWHQPAYIRFTPR